MKLRRLGKTELQVSEIGFGGEWLERHPEADGIELILLHQAGVAAAVDQAKAVSRARMLGGVGGAQRKKGVVDRKSVV